MKSIVKGEIDSLLFCYPTFLFGAGSTGKYCFSLLKDETSKNCENNKIRGGGENREK